MTEQPTKLVKEDIPKNVVRCLFCNEPLKIDTLGCIVPRKDVGLGICCNDILCLIEFHRYRRKHE